MPWLSPGLPLGFPMSLLLIFSRPLESLRNSTSPRHCLPSLRPVHWQSESAQPRRNTQAGVPRQNTFRRHVFFTCSHLVSNSHARQCTLCSNGTEACLICPVIRSVIVRMDDGPDTNWWMVPRDVSFLTKSHSPSLRLLNWPLYTLALERSEDLSCLSSEPGCNCVSGRWV